MTFVSVTQASTRLGIDAKTLHRWLAQAQLPVRRHPQDARKHGVSEEHLQALARLHQRRLTPLTPEPAALVESLLPALGAALLALPERLDALHTQLGAVQQHVTELTRLLQPPAHPSGRPACPKEPDGLTRRSAKRRPAARAKPLRKPAHVIPRVEYVSEGHYVVLCPKHGVLPFEPDTQEWFAWVAQQSSFRFVGQAGHFTAHHEGRVPRGAWRAHRHLRNRVYTRRLAPTQELTMAVLEQVAATLQAQVR